MKIKELQNLVKDLVVISETDSEVVAFSTNQSFERLEWDNFFRKYAGFNPQWEKIRSYLEEHLDHLEVRKTRKSGAEFEYAAFGYDKQGRKQGIRFETVET